MRNSTPRPTVWQAAPHYRQSGEQAEPIALFFTDPIDTVVALLAVLKPGKFYTVLNPVQPAAALAQICRDAGAALLITDTAQLSAVHAWATDLPVCNLEEGSATTAADNLLLPAPPQTILAGIYYTSGSSGAPKGIVRDHRQLLHSTWHNTNAYQITASNRHSLLYSLALTAAVPDLLDPLLDGATLYPFDPKTSSVSALMAWLSQEEIALCVAGRSLSPLAGCVTKRRDRARPAATALPQAADGDLGGAIDL